MVLAANQTASADHCTFRRQPILLREYRSKTLWANVPRSCRTSSSECADLAVLFIGPRADLLRLLARVVALVLVARLVLVLTAVGDRAGVAVVCVNTAEHAAVAGEDVVYDDVASAAIATAVAAGSHDFAVVCCVEVLDVEGSFKQESATCKNECVLFVELTEAVELEDLV
jgi:hypothetical protein